MVLLSGVLSPSEYGVDAAAVSETHHLCHSRTCLEQRIVILAKHRDLAVEPTAVLRAVAAPHERAPGRMAGEEWFYRRGAGPSRWLKVVVHYEGARGLIVTAFARRSFP
jgi:hypothetical protein